jgi:uncharacterized membrane protein YuzA (DUF378 family)
MKILKIITFILTVIGAVNWGLVGFFGLDLVSAVFGEMSTLSRIVYVLVGLSGLYSLFTIYHCASEDI